MQIIIWFDAILNPLNPWHYRITYDGMDAGGSCRGIYDCWRAFDAVISRGVMDDKVRTSKTLVQDNGREEC